ncbi:MAG: hypothetical protein PVF17_12805 [Ignavibacteria bacterium]|jgi:formylglycine-generating enzyme required for sulfatase activity
MKNDNNQPVTIKGDCWYGFPEWIRSAVRCRSRTDFRYNNLGFRIKLEVTDDEK